MGGWGGGWFVFFFFFKQKTAYEIVSRDWSSDVCSSDLDDFFADAPLTSFAGSSLMCFYEFNSGTSTFNAIVDSYEYQQNLFQFKKEFTIF